jgi:hypothetical protein
MTTVANVIEEALGEAIGPELIVRAGRVPEGRLENLRERHSAFLAGYRLPAKKTSQLRPYLHPKLLQLTSQGQLLDYQAFFHDFDQAATPGQQENVIKKYLLYCDGVILHDPLLYILDYVGSPAHAEKTRRRFADYLSFLSYIRPLVDSGVVTFIDEAPYRNIKKHAVWPVPLVFADDLSRLAQRIDIAEGPRRIPETEKEFILWYGMPGLSSSLVARQYHRGNLDLFFPNDILWSGFQNLGESLNAPESNPGYRVKLLNRLMKIPLPNLDALSVTDIVNLRRNEEIFEHWRTSFERALERIELHGPDAEGQEINILSRELKDAARALDESVAESSLLARAKRGLWKVSLATLAALLVTHAPDTIPVITVAAATEGLELLSSYFLAGKKSEGSFMRHLAVFEDTKEGRTDSAE